MKKQYLIITLFFLTANAIYAQFTLDGQFRPRTEYRHGFGSLIPDAADAGKAARQRVLHPGRAPLLRREQPITAADESWRRQQVEPIEHSGRHLRGSSARRRRTSEWHQAVFQPFEHPGWNIRLKCDPRGLGQKRGGRADQDGFQGPGGLAFGPGDILEPRRLQKIRSGDKI